MKWVLLMALSVGYLVDHRVQDAEIAAAGKVDESLWLDSEEPNGLVLHRRSRSARELGAVLILSGADGGPDAPSHAVVARMQLPFHGWSTYFARVPRELSGAQLRDILLGYASLVRDGGAESTVLVAEGPVGLACVELAEALAVDGLVLINMPTEDIPKDLLETVVSPALLLQENPARWPEEYALGPDVELHLLSKVDVRRKDNRLLRKIRGWFKRRFVEA